MIRKYKALGIIVFLTVVAFLNVSPQPTNAADPTGTLADIIERGYIKVGSDIAYPPFEDLNLDTGVAEGLVPTAKTSLWSSSPLNGILSFLTSRLNNSMSLCLQ
ncbi:MAG: hypothetical protein ACXAEI_20085 [Candidatus Hodarchaeales archaeon]